MRNNLIQGEWRAQACWDANHDLTHNRWAQFIGDSPYEKTYKSKMGGGISVLRVGIS